MKRPQLKIILWQELQLKTQTGLFHHFAANSGNRDCELNFQSPTLTAQICLGPNHN